MLMRALDSLACRVEIELKEWRTMNVTRKDLAYSFLQGVVLRAADDPMHHIIRWLLLAVALSTLAWVLGVGVAVWYAKPYESADVISYIAPLWAAQAAIDIQ